MSVSLLLSLEKITNYILFLLHTFIYYIGKDNHIKIYESYMDLFKKNIQ